jgi:replicative DNA helicase
MPKERQRRLSFVSIEPSRVTETRCISVTHPSQLYVTEDFIVTHNTAVGLNIAHSVALKARLPVGIFSIEMSAEQLAQRFIAMQAQVDSQKLRSGRMSDSDWERLVQAVAVLSESPIFVDDTPALSVAEMRSKARRLHAEQGLGLLIVDYLQLMHGVSNENRVQELSRAPSRPWRESWTSPSSLSLSSPALQSSDQITSPCCPI